MVDATAPLTGWRYYSRCKECNNAQCRAYSAGSKPKRNGRLRAWRKGNPSAAHALDRRRHLSRYGLTTEQFDAMVAIQDGRCNLCRRKIDLVIDHCHKTQRIRGLLCLRCNTNLGWIETNLGITERIASYLGTPCHAEVLLELANPPICEAV
jgi:hypothetical protein